MWLSKYFVDFIIFSCMGWIYETIYCTIKKKQWDNRGFLYGPVCPIYGCGAVGCEILIDYFTKIDFTYSWWMIFIISFLGSIVLEYGTSWALEKLFHAYWWDYSNIPFNIKGRVCLPCSIGFGFAGIVVVYLILPFTENITRWMNPITTELIGLILMAIVSIDATLTVSALTQFDKSVEAIEVAWNSYMEAFVKNVQDATAKISEERERFSKDRLEQAYASMGFSVRSALSRVQGFRPRRGEVALLKDNAGNHKLTRAVRMNKALMLVKEKFSRKK